MSGLSSKLPPERLLQAIEDLLRTMPSFEEMTQGPQTEWFGRALAVVAAWDSVQAVAFNAAVRAIHSGRIQGFDEAVFAVQTMLNRARFDLMLHTPGSGTKVVPKGQPFDYFDEVRKHIERARTAMFFVDPYLDADFVGRYLPHVHDGVDVRLLGRERISKLLPAVEVMRKQRPALTINVRSAGSFHDRFVFIDGRECFQSGASFSDGGVKTPTTLTPVMDAFVAVQQLCEQLWSTADLAIVR